MNDLEIVCQKYDIKEKPNSTYMIITVRDPIIENFDSFSLSQSNDDLFYSCLSYVRNHHLWNSEFGSIAEYEGYVIEDNFINDMDLDDFGIYEIYEYVEDNYKDFLKYLGDHKVKEWMLEEGYINE